MIDRQAIGRRWDADGSKRDERGRRLFAASETRATGWGGLVAVSEISGLARSTIERGLKDLDGPAPSAGRIRRDGGGPRLSLLKNPSGQGIGLAMKTATDEVRLSNRAVLAQKAIRPWNRCADEGRS